ncbi:unnamed protein product [Schistosoma curassoni]|uniref:Uncharacterized protein n=1 Tax=Schistosoma curassoni TaxID=6186 RepID=A0A183KC60_9TREM|nr:unnamed protein product [Schistosoma curassoni]
MNNTGRLFCLFIVFVIPIHVDTYILMHFTDINYIYL